MRHVLLKTLIWPQTETEAETEKNTPSQLAATCSRHGISLAYISSQWNAVCRSQVSHRGAVESEFPTSGIDLVSTAGISVLALQLSLAVLIHHPVHVSTRRCCRVYVGCLGLIWEKNMIIMRLRPLGKSWWLAKKLVADWKLIPPFPILASIFLQTAISRSEKSSSALN